MDILLWCVVFIISLSVLIKASDYFIISSEKIGAMLGLPPFVIGVTIVAIGTSLPELISSIFSVLSNCSEIVIGNVLGSNITNIFLVLGLASVIGKSFSVKYDLMKVELPMLLFSAFIIALMIWDCAFSIGETVICIACIVLYSLSSMKSAQEQAENIKKKAATKDWVLLIISPIFIFISGKYTIDAVINISKVLSIGSEVIALSVVAFGTSLPEVFVTISAIKRNKPEMAIGNVIGSNIFNSFAVLGISSLFGELTIPKNILTFSLPVSIIATILCVFITLDGKINRWEGSFLIMFYVYFIGKLYGFI